MIIRTKLIWRILLILFILWDIWYYYDKFIHMGLSLSNDWLGLSGVPILGFAFIFILQTIRIRLDKQGISYSWYVGLPNWKLWEFKWYVSNWHNVVGVSSVLPLWLPGLHFILVTGTHNGSTRMVGLGFLFSKKKESLIYISERVPPSVIDKDVQKLIDKYTRKLKSACTK